MFDATHSASQSDNDGAEISIEPLISTNYLLSLEMFCLLGLALIKCLGFGKLGITSRQRNFMGVFGVVMVSPILYFAYLLYRLVLIPLYSRNADFEKTDETDISL